MSSYFAEHYLKLAFPADAPGVPGFRICQIGAAHAIAAHFTTRADPALVAMPTGSGKTGVINAVPFALRAERVLVVTSGRLVREQLVGSFRTLDVLRRIRAVPDDLGAPVVQEVSHQLADTAAWEALRTSDVVVALPQSASPHLEGVAQPPPDLFDLVLVDEGHHAAASTWRALLEAFPRARRVLFTATPFRRDAREVPGHVAYHYPVARAFSDGIFAPIKFRRVEDEPRETVDERIAQEAERVLRADWPLNPRHRLMVRTDTKVRAKELRDVYLRVTSLKLEVVNSDYSLRWVEGALRRLRAGELDGVICVDMLGEGFDLPELKIAAIHSPHKSLGATLQFIGRFVRTNATGIGDATFIASPSSMDGQGVALYQEGAVWQEMVPNLLEGAVDAEVRVKNALATFERGDVADEMLEDLSLYSLFPHFHTKILRTTPGVDLGAELEMPSPYDLVFSTESADLDVRVLVLQRRNRPLWTDLDLFDTVEHELVVMHWSRANNLLFIVSSHRTPAVYETLARQVDALPPVPLEPFEIHRVLRGLTDFRFHSIGLRSNVAGGKSETYRTMAGPRADARIGPETGRAFHHGHCYASASDGGKDVTIGTSGMSKVWSQASGRLPELVDWCRDLASRIAVTGAVSTSTRMDTLSVGERATAVPADVFACTWQDDAQGDILGRDAGGHTFRAALSTAEFTVDRGSLTPTTVECHLHAGSIVQRLSFDLFASPRFALAGPDMGLEVEVEDGREPLLAYVNDRPLRFFTADFSSLVGGTLYRLPPPPTTVEARFLNSFDWVAAGVDIEIEVGPTPKGAKSVQAHVQERLLAATAPVILFDHRSWEIADFVAIEDDGVQVIFSFYHCKASGGAAPRADVSDAYEVCGQAVRTVRYMHDNATLRSRLLARHHSGSPLLRGTVAETEALFAAARSRPSLYRVVLAQPGISVTGMSSSIAALVHGAATHVVACGSAEFSLWSSP